MGTTHRFARISVPLVQEQFEHNPLKGHIMFPPQFMKQVHSSRHSADTETLTKISQTYIYNNLSS